MKSSADTTRVIVGIFVVVGLAVAFWMLMLSPKRKEADELGTQAEGLQVSLATAQSEVADAEAARRKFPKYYRQLVVLGKAVPAGDETSSLLVELNHIGVKTEVDFEKIALGTVDGSAATEEAAPAPEPAPEEAPPKKASCRPRAWRRPRPPLPSCRSAPPSARPGSP